MNQRQPLNTGAQVESHCGNPSLGQKIEFAGHTAANEGGKVKGLPRTHPKWIRWRWWKRYLPEPNRRLEVFFIFVFGVAFGIYLKMTDSSINERNSEMLRQQVALENDMEHLLEVKSEAGVTAALMPYLSCSANAEANKMAITIMQTSAIKQWKTVSAVLPADCASLRQSGIDPNVLKEHAARAADEAEFTRQVANGLQYYRDHLWEFAAAAWSGARNMVPSTYIESKMIDLGDINIAQAEFQRGNYIKSSDLFREGFRKIIAK